MKKTTKFSAGLAAAVLGVTSLSGLSANAVLKPSTSGMVAPEGYTEFDDKGFFSNEAHTLYIGESGDSGSGYYAASYVEYYNYTLNCTDFLIPKEKQEAFEAIYAKYQDVLQYATSEVKDSVRKDDDGNAVAYKTVKMYDTDPTEYTNKRDLALKMAKELKAAGIAETATFCPSTAEVSEGVMKLELAVNNIMEDDQSQEDAMSAIQIAAKQSDVSSEITVSLNKYADDAFEVSGMTTVEDTIAVAEAIQAAYPNAQVGVIGYALSDLGDPATSTTLDLTTAHYTGDIDNDETIDSQDALDTLQYVSTLSAGGTDVTLTTGDDETEEAAALDAADVNADGEIDTTDAYLILKHYSTEAAGGVASWE